MIDIDRLKSKIAEGQRQFIFSELSYDDLQEVFDVLEKSGIKKLKRVSYEVEKKE